MITRQRTPYSGVDGDGDGGGGGRGARADAGISSRYPLSTAMDGDARSCRQEAGQRPIRIRMAIRRPCDPLPLLLRGYIDGGFQMGYYPLDVAIPN